METLCDYVLTGNMTNQNAGYSLWCFAEKNGREYFIKQFLAPKFPYGDTISSEERIRKKIVDCVGFEKKKSRIYAAVNRFSDGNDVRVVDFFRVKSKYYIAMEKIRDLSWKISDIAALPESDKRRLCAVIAHAVAGLHEGRLVHADLKHENILFAKTPSGLVSAKIIDFDSAFTEDDPPLKKEDISGDWVYFAPEVWGRFSGENTNLSCKIDVFALGILFYRYFTGELPEYDMSAVPGFTPGEKLSVGQAIWRGGTLVLKEELPEDIRRLFLGMLARDADKRPSAREVFRALRPDLAEEELSAEKVQPDNGKAEEETRKEENPPLRVHYCAQCGCQMTEEGEVCASCRKKQATSFFYRPTGL